MAKRYTATEKWGKAWFRRLSAYQKLAWFYICDNCDACGIWDGDTELACFVTGIPSDFDWRSLVEATDGRLIAFREKFFLVGFCAFHYPGGLNDTKNLAVKKVQPRLFKLGLLKAAEEAYHATPFEDPSDGVDTPF